MKRTLRAALLAALMALAVTACSPPPPLPTIGPEGGTVTASDGAKVVVPAGALASDVALAITRVGSGSPDLPPDFTSAGPVYALTPHGTSFLAPVTISVPLSPAASGSSPRLLKTNTQGDWFELNGAVVAQSSEGDVLSAETTSFSYLTTVTFERQVNSDGLHRTWHVFGIPYAGNGATLLVPPPEEQAEGVVRITEPYSEVYSTANGKTYWVYGEAPRRDTPDDLAGIEVNYAQAQSFRKDADDATLKFIITAVRLEGANYGGLDILPYECVGSPVCDLKLFAKVNFLASVWTSGQNPRTLLRTGGHATLTTTGVQLTPNQPIWSVSTGTYTSAPLWGLLEDDFEFEVNEREGFLRLKQPITVEVDLAGVTVGELVTADFRVEVEAMNQVQGETSISGFFRDPLEVEGAEIEYLGLTPIAELQPEPEATEAEECTTAIDPAAGTVQFAASSYDLLELPIGVTDVVVTREGGTSGDVSVRVRSHDDTAVEGEDFLGIDQVVFFPAGDDLPRTITLPLVVDDVSEDTERLTLRLSEPRGCVGMGSPAVATLDIYDNDTPVDPDANTFGVSGTVSGLLGSGLVLTGFGDHDVTVDSNGPFAFDQKWPSGVSYDVQVSQQPSNPLQACTVTNGTGTLQAADVTNVLVTCAPPQGAHPYLDPSFGVAGRVTAPLGFGGEVVDVLVQSDGKVLVLDDRKLSRFTAGGAPDAGFGSGGSVGIEFLGTSYDRAFAMALQADGKIVVVGESQVSVVDENGHDWAAARYTPAGAIDLSFGGAGTGVVVGDLGSTSGSPYHESLGAVAVQPDGKIVLGGSVNRFNLGSDFLVMRLTTAGVLDSAFGSGGIAVGIDIAGSSDIAESLSLQPDGKILLAGRVAPNGGSDPDIGILRYHPNGDLDEDFGDAGVLRDVTDDWDQPFDMLVLPGGEILVAGLLNRSVADGGAVGVLARYTEDGESDAGFGTGGRSLTEGLWSAASLARQADGKLVVVGTAQPGTTHDDEFAVLRLGADGAADTSFGDAGVVAVDFYGGNDTATSVALQEDGKLLVAGGIENGATSEMGLIRVMP